MKPLLTIAVDPTEDLGLVETQHPTSIKTVLLDGAVARLVGKSPEDNPFRVGSGFDHIWARGFALGSGVPGALAEAEKKAEKLLQYTEHEVRAHPELVGV